MPADAQCKIQYLSREAVPRQVFCHLRGRDAPSNPTQLAKEMGREQNTLQGWYMKMPAYQQDLLAKKYGFDTPTSTSLMESWHGDDCETFKRKYEEHWKPVLSKQAPPPVSFRDRPATQSAAFAWNPPTTRAQVLKRLKVIALEERTGNSGGSLVLAIDTVAFEGDEPQLACIRKDGQWPRSKDKELATIELRSAIRNEGVLPWPLDLDLNLGRSDGLFVRESRVEFGLGKHAQVEEFAKREQFPGSQNVVRPNGRPVAAKSGLSLVPGGDSFEPHYVVRIANGPIGPFTFYGAVKLTKIAAGQEVQVRLVAAIKGLTDDGESSTQG